MTKDKGLYEGRHSGSSGDNQGAEPSSEASLPHTEPAPAMPPLTDGAPEEQSEIPTNRTDLFAEYARPLTEGADGSVEEMKMAWSIATICWNLSMLEDPVAQENFVLKIKEQLPFGEEEFAQFREDILEMMIARHLRMFPSLHKSKGV